VEKNLLGTGISFPIRIPEDEKPPVDEEPPEQLEDEQSEDEEPPENKEIATAVGEQSVKESILIILGTAKGERVMRPNFGCGLNELVFAPNDTTTAAMATEYVTTALQTWEPRIKLEEVNANPDSRESNLLNIDINYSIIATNTKRNLVYPFYLV